jgi:hypothetical protein
MKGATLVLLLIVAVCRGQVNGLLDPGWLASLDDGPVERTFASVPGLKVWLEADSGAYSDAGTTVAVHDGGVQQWNDRSGNGNHFAQGVEGNRPWFHTNVLNGHPSLYFGTNDFISDSYGTTYAQPLTIFVIGRVPDTSATRRMVSTPSVGDTGPMIFFTGATDAISYDAGSVIGSGVAAFPHLGEHVLHTVRAAGASSYARTNGVAYVSGNAGTEGSTGHRLGGRWNTVQDYLSDGYITAFLLYSGAMSDADRDWIESELKQKYGL